MPDHLQITPEEQIIRDIEPRDGRIQPNIRLGDMLPEQERLVARLGEVVLDAIQGLEQRVDVGLVGLLGRREAGLVDPVVDERVDPFVHGVDFGPQVFGV